MPDAISIASLLSAAAVRTRARMIFDAGTVGTLPHFTLHLGKLPACAAWRRTQQRRPFESI